MVARPTSIMAISSSTRRKIAVGLAAAGSAPLVSAGVAGADPGVCESGEVCLFENNDYNQGGTPHVRQWTGDDATYTNNDWYDSEDGSWTTDGLNDEASSIKNQGTSCNVALYQHSNYSGASSTFARGASDGYLTNNNIGDNRASSHDWCV